MNTLLQIALTLALSVGTVAAWHVLVADDAAAPGDQVQAVGDRDLAALEARVDALENRAPLLRGTTDGGERLLDLEARLQALEAAPARRTAGRTADVETADEPVVYAPSGAVLPPSEQDVEAALTEAQKQAVRRLVEGTVRERMQDRFSGRTTRALEELGIELTTEQREKLDAAWAAHMETVRETFRTSRDAGLDREAVGTELAALNRKLTENVATFLPAGDAESIVGALTSGPPGPGSGRMGGGRPR